MTFRSNIFVSQHRKISLVNTSVFQKISGREKNLRIRGGGGYHDFPSITISPLSH